MRDLPTGPSLLGLARNILLNDLLPLLPEEAHLDARLVANSMAIAARESVGATKLVDDTLNELAALYGEQPGNEAGGDELLRRFGHDLRIGAFEGAPWEGRARQSLWRFAIAKLRLANPRFLTANGFD